jgi:serine/threonine protein kinase
MGLIYQAHDPVIDRKLAIKLIRADLLTGEDTADSLARFQREAQAVGRCVHPNIVAIYDFAVHEGNPFIAMEYVEGSNLSQALTRSGRFTPDTAIDVIGQVLDALACAHGAGIVHRDVKPANILLSDGRVKMTDFGISRSADSALTQSGSVIGSPSYMSPEQCRGDAVDVRSDLFSTGVVLYELLSGERPFVARSLAEVALQIMHQPAPALAAKCPGLSSAIVSVVDRALAKRPEDRFASAAGMAAALRQADQDADRTVIARGPVTSFTDATLSTIERRLAQHVGPIAHHLVQSAARRASSLEELHDILAQRIEQPAERTRFRDSGPPAQPQGEIASELVQRAERELTRYIGPIGRVLVKRALTTAKSADELWQLLATHIERDNDRQAFLLTRSR